VAVFTANHLTVDEPKQQQ